MVRTGQLRAAHYGTAWRISHADLEAFVAQAMRRHRRPRLIRRRSEASPRPVVWIIPGVGVVLIEHDALEGLILGVQRLQPGLLLAKQTEAPL